MDSLMDQVGGVLAGIIDNPLIRLATAGFVAYVTIVWLASAWWVLHDMRRRHPDPTLPYAAAAGVVLASPVLFPLALVVYRIVRPGRTLAESREQELTERLEYLEQDLALSCPGCSRPVEEDWLVCPTCRSKLAHRCANCSRTMALDWTLCGWCGAEFGRTMLPERLPGAVRAGARRAERGRLERSGGERAAFDRPAFDRAAFDGAGLDRRSATDRRGTGAWSADELTDRRERGERRVRDRGFESARRSRPPGRAFEPGA